MTHSLPKPCFSLLTGNTTAQAGVGGWPTRGAGGCGLWTVVEFPFCMDERLLFRVGCGCEWLSLVPIMMVACKIRGQGQSLCSGDWCKACQRVGCVEQQAAAALGQNHSPAQGRGKAAGHRANTVGIRISKVLRQRAGRKCLVNWVK